MTLQDGITPEIRELFLDELGDADVLEADGVEHAGGGLDDAGRGMSLDGLERYALGDEGADALE